MQKTFTAVKDIAGLVGVCLISYGTWLVYQPAGYIVAGLFLLVGAVLLSGRAR